MLTDAERQLCSSKLKLRAEVVEWVAETPPAVIVVGEQASSSAPLFPWPRQSAGDLLCQASRLSRDTFLGMFERHALITCASWSDEAARTAAAALLTRWADPVAGGRQHPERRPVVVVGERAAAAFGIGARSTFRWAPHPLIGEAGPAFVVIPYPPADGQSTTAAAIASTMGQAWLRAAAHVAWPESRRKVS